MITLENNQLKIEIALKGAELKNVLDKVSNFEFMWQANDASWGRTAPILFPVVGKPFNNELLIDDNVYAMPQHGFARDMDFKVIEKSNTKVVFSLFSNAETRKIFPFDFELQLSYSLIENAIEFGYEVKNMGGEKMYFSIGAHPGFNLPSKKMTDYFLEFEYHENAQRYLLEDGLLNGQSEPILENQNKIHLDKNLFDKDAIVLKNINSKKMTLASTISPFKVEMSWNNFPYFGVWSKKGCEEFICLEPWCGIAGSTDGQTNIENKEGINELSSNEIFERKYFISFYS